MLAKQLTRELRSCPVQFSHLGPPHGLLPHPEGGPCQYETALLEEYKPALHLVLGKIQHFVLFVFKKNGSIQNVCITSNLIFGAYAARDQPDITVIRKVASSQFESRQHLYTYFNTLFHYSFLTQATASKCPFP